MAAPNNVYTPVGARGSFLFALDSATGLIDPGAASATAYAGVQIEALKELQLTDPEPQQIFHMGDDRIFAVDALPATEAITGTIMTGKVDLTSEAALTGNLVVTVGEAKVIGIGTDNKGSEVQVGMFFYRQALDTGQASAAQGARRWESKWFPSTLAIPLEAPMGGTEFAKSYTFRPQFVKKYLWGMAFVEGTEGYVQAQGQKMLTQYKPKLVVWKGNNVLTQFNLPTAFPAVSTDKMEVFIYDAGAGTVAADATATLATTTVDPTATPDVGDLVFLLYEHNQ